MTFKNKIKDSTGCSALFPPLLQGALFASVSPYCRSVSDVDFH